MLCVYSHLIIFHELYKFGVSRKCGIVVKSVKSVAGSSSYFSYCDGVPRFLRTRHI